MSQQGHWKTSSQDPIACMATSRPRTILFSPDMQAGHTCCTGLPPVCLPEGESPVCGDLDSLSADLSICLVNSFPYVLSPVQAAKGARGRSGQSLCPGHLVGQITSPPGNMRSRARHGPQSGLERPEHEHPELASWLRQKSKCAQRRFQG